MREAVYTQTITCHAHGDIAGVHKQTVLLLQKMMVVKDKEIVQAEEVLLAIREIVVDAMIQTEVLNQENHIQLITETAEMRKEVTILVEHQAEKVDQIENIQKTKK